MPLCIINGCDADQFEPGFGLCLGHEGHLTPALREKHEQADTPEEVDSVRAEIAASIHGKFPRGGW